MGTFLVNQVRTLADSMGNPVLFSARPIGAFSEEKLQRLGFEVYDAGFSRAYMLRKPGGI
jgi:hypothetical protein